MNCPNDMEIDHIDGNGLNNQKENLRICTRSENMRNRDKQADNLSGYKGVYKKDNRYRAQITVEGKQIYLGSYQNIEDAVKAYNEASIKYHGKFSKTNF